MKNISVFALVFMLVFAACETTVTQEDLEETAEVVDQNLESEYQVLRAFENVNNYGIAKKTKKAALMLDDEPEHSWVGNTLTLNFTGITGMSGEIIADFSDEPSYSKGIVIDVSFNEFTDGETSINGSMQISIADSMESKIIFEIVTNENLLVNNINLSTWNCNQVFEWIEGLETIGDISDDAYVINGITNQDDEDVGSSLKLIDLYYANNCKFIKSGIIEISKDSSDKLTTCDFGVDSQGNESSECNGYVLLSYEGISLIHNFDN